MAIYYFLLGSHKEISSLEIAKKLAATQIAAEISPMGPLLRVETSIDIPDNFLSQLGGTDRILKHITSLSHQPGAEDILEALSPLPPKWRIGLSVLRPELDIKLQKLGIEIKKAAREKNSKVAFMTPSGNATHLNAAQVIFNRLTKDSNSELFLFSHNNEWIIARTIQIQDIQAYEKRDTSRPARDPKAGMLPPKLAQMMLNIAIASAPKTGPLSILDPFCGTGTLLQEGWLMGYQMIGTDADTKMIQASADNLRWLSKNFKVDTTMQPQMQILDVQISFPAEWKNSISAVVTESYLGKARSTPLLAPIADRDIKKLGKMYVSFYRNMYPILQNEGVILAALPQIKTSTGWAYLPLEFIDEITRIGYRQEKLSSTPRGTLTYKRPDAVVARELILFKKTA